jgi:hypothetical protein
VSAAMTEILQWWETIKNPQARRAPISILIKSKQRGLQRIQKWPIQRGDVPLDMYTRLGIAQLLGRRSDERQRPGT